jgi:hypothetical protein
MKVSLLKCFWVQVVCLSLVPILGFAQSSSDLAQNLEACKNGLADCDRSRLTQAQSADVARGDQQRNLSNCRDGVDSCDRSKLSEREATALAIADHQRNVSDCNAGMRSCDRSKLTQSESREIIVAERQRNLAERKDGVGDCDRSKLTQTEIGQVNVAMRQRNGIVTLPAPVTGFAANLSPIPRMAPPPFGKPRVGSALSWVEVDRLS